MNVNMEDKNIHKPYPNHPNLSSFFNDCAGSEKFMLPRVDSGKLKDIYNT